MVDWCRGQYNDCETSFNLRFRRSIHRSLTSKTILIQRPNQMRLQASENPFRSKSSVNLYSSSVQRNDAYPIAVTPFSRTIESFFMRLFSAMLSSRKINYLVFNSNPLEQPQDRRWEKTSEVIEKVEKHPPSRVSTKSVAENSAVSSKVVVQIIDCSVKRNIDGCTQKNSEDTSEMKDIDNDCQTVQNARSNKLQRTNQNVRSPPLSFFRVPVPPNSSTGQGHSSFSPDDNSVRSKPNSHRSASARIPSPHQSVPVANPIQSAANRRRSL